MELENWMLAQEREEQWEDFLLHCPVCIDCGRVITQGLVLPMDEDGSFGCLCPGCVQDRMVPVEEME